MTGECKPETYQIKVEGRLDEKWSDWFHGLTITFETGMACLLHLGLY